MNLNNEPAISPFLIFQIGALFNRIHRECDKIFRQKAFLLEMDQIPVVLKLYYQGRASQQEISSGLQKDMVKVIQDTTDKRKTQVELTATGKKLAMKAHAILEEFDTSLSSVLTAEEKKQFHQTMHRLIGTVTAT